MNILVVTQYFWPESFRINDMTQGLKDMGHDISVFTDLPNYPSGKWTKWLWTEILWLGRIARNMNYPRTTDTTYVRTWLAARIKLPEFCI